MRTRPLLRDLAWAATLLVLVYVAGVGAVHFRPGHSSVATWWPAAAFAVALVARGRRSWWPALLLGIVVSSALANLSGGRPLEVSLLFGLANAAEAWVAGAVLRARTDEFRLDSSEGYFRLVIGCTLGAATIGLGAGLTVALTGGNGMEAARTVAPSHLASMLVILPLMLLARDVDIPRQRTFELAAQTGMTIATTLLVFWPAQPLALAFLPLPLLIWAALRFTPYVVAAEVLLLGVLTTFLTASGGGPFAVGIRSAAVDAVLAGAQVQVFLVCAALMALPASLASAQRKELLRHLTAERELTASTLATTAAIIMVTDRDGTVLRVNPATCRLTGYAEEELLAQPIWELDMIPAERKQLVRQMFEEPDGSEIPDSREADVMTSTGERIRVVWNNNLVLDAQGHVTNAVFTGSDVTSERTTTGMLRHLLEAPMATALIGLDAHGRITLFSRGAQEMLGHDAADVIGQPITHIVTAEQPTTYIDHVAAQPPRRPSVEPVYQPLSGDWTWRTVGGSTLTVSSTISVVENVTGKAIGYLCVGRDVTEQRRTQEVLVEALEKERHGVERLRRLDAAKNDFVSTVSHELRTPTTSIVGYTEMLRDGSAGEPTAAQIPMLEAIARNGTRLISVASDLLTLSELESDSANDWEREAVDLSSIMAHGEEAIRPLLANRDLTVEFDVPSDAVTVIGDAAHLDRVLMNLLSNAVKFTPDGGQVTCRLVATHKWARLEVADTGIGIPEDEQGDLFTKFFRSSTAQERAIQGTGLGLSIIDQIVAAHGGDIDVRSAHLQGTTFTVTLPLARQAVRAALRTG